MKRSFIVVICTVLLGMLAVGLVTGCGDATTDESTTTVVGEATTTTTSAATTTTAAGSNYPDMIYPKMVGNSTGGPAFDVEKFKATPAAAKLAAWMKNGFMYKDEMDPAVLAYWDALGVKKELHDADAGDKELKWASYAPLEALAADNTAVYPVVFCFHGGYGSIFGAEGFGIADLGAKERFITVCAATPGSRTMGEITGLTAGEQVTRILDQLEAGGYPIDRGRVYLTGQSIGGMACAWAALEIPDVVTAIAPHSSGAVLNTDPAGLGTVALSLPESDFAKVVDYGVPMYLEVGDSDMGTLPYKTQGAVDGLNLWLQVNGCPTQLTLEECLAAQGSTADPAVKLIGFVGDKTWTETLDGVVYHGVEFFRADGVKMVEIVGVENCPHWLTAGYPELAWEFMSRFSRDADGKLVVAK